MVFNKTRQYNIQMLHKIIFIKYRTRQIKATETNKKVTYLKEGRKEMFYLTTHSTHFIYGYMASGIW